MKTVRFLCSILTSLALLSSTSAQQETYATDTTDLNRELGDSVTLECQFEDNSAWSNCLWLWDDTFLIESQRRPGSDQALTNLNVTSFDTDRYHLHAEEQSCRLQLTQLDYSDSGVWSCSLETITGRAHRSQTLLEVFNPGQLAIEVFLEPFEVVKDKPYHVKCSVKGEPSPEPRLSAYVSWNTRDSGTPYSHSERSVYSLKGEDYGAQYMPIGDDSTGEVSQPRGEDTQGLYLRRGDSEGEARRELLLTTHDSNASLTTGMFVYKPQLGDNRASVVCRAEQTDTSGERVLAESVRLATRRVDRLFVAPEILARRGPVAKQCYQTGTWELEVTGHPLPGVNDVHLIMLAQHSTESLDHILSTRETQGHLEVGGRCSDLDPGVIYVLAARTPVGNCSREISLLLASEGVPEEGGRQADDMWFVLMVGGVAFVAVMVCLLVAVIVRFASKRLERRKQLLAPAKEPRPQTSHAPGDPNNNGGFNGSSNGGASSFFSQGRKVSSQQQHQRLLGAANAAHGLPLQHERLLGGANAAHGLPLPPPPPKEMEDCNEGSGDLYLLPVGSEAAAAALASWRFQPGEGGPFAVGAEEAQHIYEEVELPELPASSSSLSLGGSLRTKRAGGVAGTMASGSMNARFSQSYDALQFHATPNHPVLSQYQPAKPE